MSTVIIGNGGGGKAAIDKLVNASHQGQMSMDQSVIAAWLIARLIELANLTPGEPVS
jgi:cell division GTPase FtsZ